MSVPEPRISCTVGTEATLQDAMSRQAVEVRDTTAVPRIGPAA